ncbi:glucomannan 4-beta-mannosyltransferase 1-like [Phragmites australis]|uniref:glucomannan 4-beta-mannosyltransferase 1-like n=1 Tax=Phragmites australis TaxID=29695 RepID=UPI002D76BD77|nr:glucomannan 4-beta-mannosyltransferase 1-like [Phragmites australis]
MRSLGFGTAAAGSPATMRAAWRAVRWSVVVPTLQLAVYVCAAMSLMLFLERLYMAVVVAGLWLLRGRKRAHRRDGDQQQDDLVEAAADHCHPMVLVQIPMFNEKQVYRLSIGAACGISWPSDRLVIQVLDDSTDPAIRELVEVECARWAGKGVRIRYENRSNRSGYKAGAMREGLKKQYVKECEFVAIFDADFQPDADFLRRTVPLLQRDPGVALVQARWRFVNANDCILTRIQEMSLNYHFAVEQEVGSACHAFFGFNGTAGVWRIAALADAGGWKERTTVEDMDLAVRASLRGWRFVYAGDLDVPNELPSTFRAYRYQQHRWSCGPANLLRKVLPEILHSDRVSPWKKLHLIYGFFFVRKVVAHLVTFLFYCVVIPACVLVQGDVRLPKYVAMYVPAVITLLNAVCTPRSWHLLIFWILFENVMSMHRSKAAVIGLLGASRANEWVVTDKLGSGKSTTSGVVAPTRRKKKKPAAARKRLCSREVHVLELVMGACLLYCAVYDMVFFGHDHFYIYLLLQSAAAFIVGFGYVGTFVPAAAAS